MKKSKAIILLICMLLVSVYFLNAAAPELSSNKNNTKVQPVQTENHTNDSTTLPIDAALTSAEKKDVSSTNQRLKISAADGASELKIASYVKETVKFKIRCGKENINHNELQPSHSVYLQIISAPEKAKGHILTNTVINTNESGIAEGSFVIGDKSGDYTILANSPEIPGLNLKISIEAKKNSWMVDLIIGLIGGLAFFIYGMGLMGDGLIKIGGSKMSSIINKLCSNTFMGVLVGTFVTMVIQSSSATTVIVVGLINAGMMNLAQSIGIIFGANIGTTITAQIIAFKLTDYALLFVGIGFIMIFASKKKKVKTIGEIIMGFGILFYGIEIMSKVMYPIRSYQPFLDYMKSLENPVMGVFVGLVFTALIQSSSAATGVFIALACQGVLTLEAAIPLTFGANIGTCVTALLACLNANREAKRAAIAHISFNILSTVIFFPFLDQYQLLIESMSSGPTGAVRASLSNPEMIIQYVPRQIANAHSIAKIIAVILFLPFAKQLAKLTMWILPDRPETENEKYKPKYLDDKALAIPTAALRSAKQEVLRMAFSTKKMLDNAFTMIELKDEKKIELITDMDDKIDSLNYSIRDYVRKISQGQMNKEEAAKQMSYLYMIGNIEQAGDRISKDLILLSKKLIDKNLSLSTEDIANLKKEHQYVTDMYGKLFTAFSKGSFGDYTSAADEIIKNKAELIKMENEYRRIHFTKPAPSDPKKNTTSIFLDVINAYHSIYSALSTCAYIMKGEF